jgi:Flp pilus assembly protein TadD
MIANSSTLTSDELVLPSPEFQLDAPGVSPFVAMLPSTFTFGKDTFDLNWLETPFEPPTASAVKFLDDILGRSERDVQRFPDNAQVHANYGVALLNRGRLEEASNEFVTALRLSPRHFMSLANLARIHVLQGKFTEAERLYEELSAGHPGDVSPLVNLAYIALRKQDFDKATLTLERANSVDAAAILPRYLMAVTLLKRGKPREAISHLRIAAKIDVRSFAVHQALGVAFVMAGEVKRAVLSFRSALALAPDKQNAVHALSNVLLDHDCFEALSALLQAHLEKAPDDAVARRFLAESFLKQRQYPTARQHFLAALHSIRDEGPRVAIQKSQLINNIGVCSDHEGDWDAAARCFLRSIEVYPGFDNVARHNLARARVRQGRFDQAWKILEACREGAPDNHETPELQALVLEKQERHEEAIQLLTTEIQTGHATEGSYAWASGLLAEVKHDFESAYRITTEGLRQYPRSILLMNNLAYSLLMNGHAGEARRILESMPTTIKTSRVDVPTVLTATWGLLYLWEGNIEQGTEQYELAELLARETPLPELPIRVQQKMHLEIAKAYLRQNDIAAAKIEISLGLSIVDGWDIYEQDLLALRNDVEKSTNSRQLGTAEQNE